MKPVRKPTASYETTVRWAKRFNALDDPRVVKLLERKLLEVCVQEDLLTELGSEAERLAKALDSYQQVRADRDGLLIRLERVLTAAYPTKPQDVTTTLDAVRRALGQP